MEQPYGFALIINVKSFKDTTVEGVKLEERIGSDVDVVKLKALWEQLGFNVRTHEGLKAHRICSVVQDMAGEIDRDQNSSCFVCCIMTHGDMGLIYGSDSQSVNIKDIIGFFKEDKCPALSGKPKLIFIQACRGSQILTGRSALASTPENGSTNSATQGTGSTNSATPGTSSSNSATPGSSSTNSATPGTSYTKSATPGTGLTNSVTQGLDSNAFAVTAADGDDDDDRRNNLTFCHSVEPNEFHFLLGYSTAPGYVSMRNIVHGTWYISALVEIFSTHHTDTDVNSMMIKVNDMVYKEYTKKGYKMCPTPVCTLTKSIFF